MFNAKKDKSKIQSDLLFLKKSGNEKKIVSKIGANIKSPTPGENSIPNIGTNKPEALSAKKLPKFATSVPIAISSEEAVDLKDGMYLITK